MKLYGVFGKGSGKVGSSVFAISGGEQIVRQHNPVVANPQTEGQVAQRAKLKLMSQLAAALSPAIAFKKKGLVSARNQFVSKNIGISDFDGSKADVPLTALQLTDSIVDFPALTAAFGAGGVLSVQLSQAAAPDIKRVVYVIYKNTDESQLAYIVSEIVDEEGAGRTFPATFDIDDTEVVVYAYGIKDNNDDATIRYENYVAQHSNDSASLDIVKLFTTSGYGLTKTVAAQVGA